MISKDINNSNKNDYCDYNTLQHTVMLEKRKPNDLLN